MVWSVGTLDVVVSVKLQWMMHFFTEIKGVTQKGRSLGNRRLFR